jgi:16S rRNA (cytosine967-C5)-methyltransferase
VTCVDSSKRRLVRLNENMARLDMDVATVVADATKWTPDEPFDAVLLDAPCSGTGTLRRHPDIAHLKGPKDLKKLAALQERLLRHAITILRPGGVLVYCTCSLEPEEGEMQIERLLDNFAHISIDPIRPDEVFGHGGWINGQGFLRTLPYDLVIDAHESSGIDGFFAARLIIGQA